MHSRDSIRPKRLQHGGPQPISKILHIENQIVCGINKHLKYAQT